MELKLKPKENIAMFLDEEHIIGTFGIELPIEKFIQIFIKVSHIDISQGWASGKPLT